MLVFVVLSVSSVVVEEGECFVKLPYKTMAPLHEDVTVEWSRCDFEPMRVHEYCNGNNDLVRQDEFYCDRTKMQMELFIHLMDSNDMNSDGITNAAVSKLRVCFPF